MLREADNNRRNYFNDEQRIDVSYRNNSANESAEDDM